jgi:hypothetical protein
MRDVLANQEEFVTGFGWRVSADELVIRTEPPDRDPPATHCRIYPHPTLRASNRDRLPPSPQAAGPPD